MWTSIEIRNKKKMDKIVKTLKSEGRRTFYEEFYDFEGKFYLLYYMRR